MTDPTTPTAGRRTRVSAPRRRLDATVLLAVLLPVVAIALLLAAGTEPVEETPRPPSSTSLTSAVLGCPSPLRGARDVRVATTEEASGEVRVGDEDLTVEPPAAAMVEASGAVTVRGSGALAPGLVAGRTGTTPLVAADCAVPSAEQWFTGIGAAARHSSVLELTNPNTGPAVADVWVLAGTGAVDAPRLRGVLVPGGQTRRLDLAAVLPRRGELALRVTTTRGRLSAAVEDTDDQLGSSEPTTDWLGSQPAPAATSTLLGLVDGPGRRSLVLANPGDDELRAEVRIVTADSVFAPSGLDEVRLAPQSTVRVLLSSELRDATADGAYGVQVRATGPVTAALRTVAVGDVSHAVPGTPVTARTIAVVPEGRKRVLLSDASAAGTVTVVARDADGRELATEEVEVTPGAGADIAVPRRAVLVEVTPVRTSVQGAVLVTGDGASVVRLRDAARDGLVPQVGAGLP